MTDASTIQSYRITVGEGAAAREIAIIQRPSQAGKGKTAVLWLGGYRSDMSGTKAIAMDELAGELGIEAVRFDYSGHGASGGAFRDGTISRWLEEAVAVVDRIGAQKLVLVGSSMGGWVALRLIQALRQAGGARTVAGAVLIAPAPDFTMDLIEPNLTDEQRQSLVERGYFEEHSEYSPEPNIYTRGLIEDGRKNQVMQGLVETGCPVHILQGMADPDVPYRHALKLMEFLPADDVVMTLIRGGDHRLSRPQDIDKMRATIAAMINE